ncbi:hypothetical protein PATSB16_30190 [Pandoraea thiooxydans]|nr:hypothetical protein PATSB16_30190 [Pandoraea thiooxydans]
MRRNYLENRAIAQLAELVGTSARFGKKQELAVHIIYAFVI